MKKCKKCNSTLDEHEFYSNRSICKSCYCHNKTMNRRTIIGKIKSIYKTQVESSRRRGHSLPSYSVEELIEFLVANHKFIELFDKWKLSGYKTKLAPSVDRINNFYGYSFDNIQITTWEQNYINFLNDRCSDKVKTVDKKVESIDSSGVVTIYKSAKHASDVLCIDSSSITKVCKGKRKTAAKLKWRYHD